MMENMIRFQIYLTPKQKEMLDDESEVTGRSVAQVVRDAIDAYLELD